jgi:DNA-binding NtrC family response regulator
VYRSFQILLVEDNAGDRALMARELSTRFSGVIIQQEWERAGLTVAMERGRFDLVITDYDLGWTNGLDLLHEIKARWPQTPVVICSGNPSIDVARAVVNAGASHFVQKSSRGFSRLLTVVETLWADVDRSRQEPLPEK